ncbi:hypothetical protein CUMW_281950 [Citrus unshiu]|uniref:UspA domain-containing protein n=1 Tax=Citrus unshiu TaxID=55188 RepID=A0A2H5MZW7_CITUN|nr:hypothetical protein CUMW_281950 [Citrus unshiu]
MDALRLEINNLKLRSPAPGSTKPPDSFIVLQVQPPPTIAAGLNPGTIPSSEPSHVEVPAFTAAIKAQSAVNVKSKVVIGDAMEKVCELVEKLHADLLVMGLLITFAHINKGCSWEA